MMASRQTDIQRNVAAHQSLVRPPSAPRRTEPWMSWPSVKAFIPRLPAGTTTWDIHRNLAKFGKIDYIQIEEDRHGNFGQTASVTFKPPPQRRAPWDRCYGGSIEFSVKRSQQDPVTGAVTYVDEPKTISVQMHNSQPLLRLVDSPIRPGIKYPQEICLVGESVDFGYLAGEDSMVVLASRGDPQATESVRLVLNLNKLQLEIYFPVTLQSKGSSVSRAYRFYVALDDHFSLCDSFDGVSPSFIIHVKNAPCYSKQLKEAMQLSHDLQSRRWASDDTWLRQTDIVDHKDNYAAIDESPVSLCKDLNSINIARWTTFRFNVKSDHAIRGKRSSTLQDFLKALSDFNVRVTGNAAFKITHATEPRASMWALLYEANTLGQCDPLRIPFDVRYQLEVCISAGCLNEYLIDQSFLKRLSEMNARRAKQMLIHVADHQVRIHNPKDIFGDIRFEKPVRSRALPPGCAELLHATVTATGVIVHTPSVEVTNRIIRKYQDYSDRFLRVRFEDDSYRGQTRLYPTTNNKMKLIFARVRRTMKQGIVVAGRHYEFLAWGNSQLREHGAYFFAATKDLNAEIIRNNMGTFDQEKIVAKRAARMGQCFSTTKPVTAVGARRQWKKDPAADVVNNNYLFTDGVGKISPLAAQLIQAELNLPGECAPSAFQFRLGGCKGVLAIDKSLRNLDMKIRPSQFKFDSESDELEIIRVSQYWQSYLNRQLIVVLSNLGIPDKTFRQMQEQCISTLEQALTDDTAALKSLRENVDPNQMTLNVAALVEAGFLRAREPFTMSLLRLYRAWTLKSLKEKAKIPIPQGAFVLGVVDETGTLRGYNESKLKAAITKEQRLDSLPEIFVQYTDQHTGRRRVVEGLCFLARNPSLHRGDIRVVRAVDVEALHHLCDVVVMPLSGDRDLPSMCSGGDLDGDDYVVCWDPELIPSEWNAAPFHYKPPTPVTKENITTNDIINFFHDYLQNDFLGRIAHAHLAAADYLDDGIQSTQCLELVNLHSMAVDYPKTGVPATMPRALERDKWPHFMEKKGRRQYASKKILGQLYDAVERVNFTPNLSDTFDRRILHHRPPKSIMDSVKDIKKQYEESLRRIMAQHQIRYEFEVWSTFVLSHSKSGGDYKFHEEIGQHSRALKESYYATFCEEAGGNDFEKLAPFAVAAYHITYEEVKDALARQASRNSSASVSNSFHSREDISGFSSSASVSSNGRVDAIETEMPMISFPWVLQDVLCKIASNTYLEEDLATLNPKARLEHDAAVLKAFDKGDTVDYWTFVTLNGPDPLRPNNTNGACFVSGNSNEVTKDLLEEPPSVVDETQRDTVPSSNEVASGSIKVPASVLAVLSESATNLEPHQQIHQSATDTGIIGTAFPGAIQDPTTMKAADRIAVLKIDDDDLGF